MKESKEMNNVTFLVVEKKRKKEDASEKFNAIMPHVVDGSPLHAESFVIVYNVAKRHNIGTLVRSASAFGVSELILVGKRKEFNSFGSHGAALYIRFRHFFTLIEARTYLKEKGCDIVGVEIKDGAKPVHSHPFTGSTAFLLGNEGTGLSDKEMEICDYFIYIAQYGCGTASLNVTVAASIILHHFGVWAGFSETQRAGQKFVVAERPAKQMQRTISSESPEAISLMRKLKKNAAHWLDDESNVEHDYEEGHLNESHAIHCESTSALGGLFEA